ncbi:hypothetical protein TNCV_4004321 [Trichonephila clavipes]|nr:hypothetical protein TNCV_4004321 [Trichonephila clavipes]
MDGNARYMVDEFLKSENISRMIWPVRLVSRPHPYTISLVRSGKGNCNSQTLSENHRGPENKVAEQVGLIAMKTLS